MTVYSFRQNNSGGFYYKPARHIIVTDANSEEQALNTAKNAGLYLNGVADNVDCDCCGDRWHDTAEEHDSLQDAKDSAGLFDIDPHDRWCPPYIVTRVWGQKNV